MKPTDKQMAEIKERIENALPSQSPNWPRQGAFKGSLSLLLSDSGEPELVPDDFYAHYGKPVAKWLGEPVYGDFTDAQEMEAASMASRAHAYAAAYRLFAEAATEDTLRDEPWVIEEYDSLDNSVTFLFVFKCENNGNTYRVRWELR